MCIHVGVHVSQILTLLFTILIGANPLSILSKIVSQCNVKARFSTDEESWPPEQPKNFTPLVLIHYQSQQHMMKQATQMAQLIQTVNETAENQSEFDSSSITKDVAEILAPFEQCTDSQFVLFEGAPGIGKSILLKEIAYRWGNGQMLTSFKLVLLVCLRDPIVQQASMKIKDLIELFCCRDARATEIATACSDHLTQSGGKELIFLFDGFDEFPNALQKNSLINDIIKRRVLPHCGLIVSSRPHASAYLRNLATVKVCILGFTDVERKHFIQEGLEGQPECITKITQYLEQHFSISSLCFVPINMAILLHLYKKGVSLPQNSTELYHYFICLTICRYLKKYGSPIENEITNLNSLPAPYDVIVKQLSKLAMEGLNDNKLVFNSEEIEAACPDIATVPGAVNCFGLLQAVQHFGLTRTTITYNFLHFSVQEFLAAYHIIQLPSHEELKILEEKFSSDIHSNMFAIYVTLTKGQRSSFKRFIQPSLAERFMGILSSGHGELKISNRFLDHQLQCIRLFKCFFDAGDLEVCRCIENTKIFKDNTINLERSQLTVTDVECMTVFLTCSSHKEWREVHLWDCLMQDRGIQILHLGVKTSNITITALELHNNGLTKSSSTAVRDITITCGVRLLGIGGNATIGEDENLYSILTDSSSVIEELYMDSTMLSSDGAIKLFKALSEAINLKVLWVIGNCITDEACDTIAMALKKNDSLCELRMESNPLSAESAQQILQALQSNDTLQKLSFPYYPQHTEDKIRQSANVNQKRQHRGCTVKLKIYFKIFSRYRYSELSLSSLSSISQ